LFKTTSATKYALQSIYAVEEKGFNITERKIRPYLQKQKPKRMWM